MLTRFDYATVDGLFENAAFVVSATTRIDLT